MSYRTITFEEITRRINKAIRTGVADNDIRRIEPETAEKILLELNGNNRTKRPAAISKYARDMESGRWEISDQIIFGMDGTLQNGQHRLFASIRSGVPLETAILFGGGNNPSLDRPVVRTLADNGKMNSGKDYNYVYVSALNNLYRIACGETGTPSDAEQMEVYENARPYIERLLKEIPMSENNIRTDAALASSILVISILGIAEVKDIGDMLHVFRGGIFTTEKEKKLRRLRDDKIGKRGAFDPRRTSRLANTTQNATREYLKYFLQYLQGAHSKKSDKTIIKMICETYDAVSFTA